MLENEYKILIDETKFIHLFKQFEMDDSLEQINYYYDTSNYSFYHKGITFRIRDSLRHKILQIKYPNIAENNYSSRIEKEFIIEELPLIISQYDIRKYISDIVIDGDIKMLGCLKTFRWIKRLENNVLLCFDKNSYLGILDYEIELEFDDYLIDISHVFDYLGIQPANSKGKYSRFIEKYLSLQKSDKSKEEGNRFIKSY